MPYFQSDLQVKFSFLISKNKFFRTSIFHAESSSSNAQCTKHLELFKWKALLQAQDDI